MQRLDSFFRDDISIKEKVDYISFTLRRVIKAVSNLARLGALKRAGLIDLHQELVFPSLFYIESISDPALVYSYAISIIAKVRFNLHLDQIWRFTLVSSLFAFQVGSKERVGKENQTDLRPPSRPIPFPKIRRFIHRGSESRTSPALSK